MSDNNNIVMDWNMEFSNGSDIISKLKDDKQLAQYTVTVEDQLGIPSEINYNEALNKANGFYRSAEKAVNSFVDRTSKKSHTRGFKKGGLGGIVLGAILAASGTYAYMSSKIDDLNQQLAVYQGTEQVQTVEGEDVVSTAGQKTVLMSYGFGSFDLIVDHQNGKPCIVFAPCMRFGSVFVFGLRHRQG